MSQKIVLKSFEELASLFPMDDMPAKPQAEDGYCPSGSDGVEGDLVDLTDLGARIEAAGVALARIVVQDQRERERAARDLERYDALVARQREAEDAREQARRIRREAMAFAGLAYAEEARAEATRIVAIAREVEEVASRQTERSRNEAERLVGELNLERLLAVRRREEEIERERAAAAERDRRRTETLARAKAAIEAGQLSEARGLLADLRTEDPNHPEVTSLAEVVARRELALKAAAAEEGVRAARRTYRRDPAGVANRLATLDLEGLPLDLRRQVFGEWARACGRLCRDRNLVAPLRYAPDLGRGAILARETPDAAYVVVSALAMGPAWQEGEVVDDGTVRRARPLR